MKLLSALLLSLSFCAPAFSQTGTIKVKKQNQHPLLTFALFEKCAGAKKDSVVKWVSEYGFKEGELHIKTYMNGCDYELSTGKKLKGMHCIYLVNDSIDMVLTCTKKNKVYCMLIVTGSIGKQLGKDLAAGSLGLGYTLVPAEKWYVISQKGSRVASFSEDKVVWSFRLEEKHLIKKQE